MTYQLKTLFNYARKNRITDKSLASSLGVHYNTIYYWRKGINEPSAIARIIIRDFLIKNL